MLLVADAGNSNVTFGLFDGDQLRAQWRIRTEPGRTHDEYAAFLGPLLAREGWTFGTVRGFALASVVPAATPALLRLARQTFSLKPLQVGPQTDLGLHIMYQPPEAVGPDRLVDALAAVHKYGAPCIVIDFGTATTFNAIAAPAAPGGLPVYLGGAICLGIGVSLDALFARAAKIPSVEIARPPRAISDNTAQALQSGIVFGTLGQINEMVTRFHVEMNAPDCPVVATGGFAETIAPESDIITATEPLLTLDGLRLAFERVSK